MVSSEISETRLYTAQESVQLVHWFCSIPSLNNIKNPLNIVGQKSSVILSMMRGYRTALTVNISICILNTLQCTYSAFLHINYTTHIYTKLPYMHLSAS